MSKKPDWLNDSDFDIEPIIAFKNEPIHVITFLDEGIKQFTKIKTDEKDDNGNAIMKDVPCVKFTVKENNETKIYTPISKVHIQELGEFFPLTNETFRIEFLKGRTDVENKYRITKLSE